MSEAVKTYEGWYAYHDFRKIDWSRWKSLAPEKREEMVQELLEVLREFASVEEERKGSFGQYAVLGHKADLLFIHFRPTLDELNEVKWRFDKTAFADVTFAPTSFISVVELSAYTVPPGTDPLSDPAFPGKASTEPAGGEICLFLPHGQAKELERQLVHAPDGRAAENDEEPRNDRPLLCGPGSSDHHRFHRLRRLGMGGFPVCGGSHLL